MSNFFLIIVLTFKLSVAQGPLRENFMVIWNVGQGQWATQVTNDTCKHFDFGGEIHYFSPLQTHFMAWCSRKINLLYLSHADLDHYSYLNLIRSRAKSICWMVRPQNFESKKNQIPMCPPQFKSRTENNQTIINEDCKESDRNACSTVFQRSKFLFPGDSPIRKEKKWASLLKNTSVIKVLILGHHGSRTSTGLKLLMHLPELKVAVSSARQSKYGHPHLETTNRLGQFGRAIVRTESWGNLIWLN